MILRETNKKKNQSTKHSFLYALTNAFILGDFAPNWFQVFLFWLSNLQIVPILLFIQLEFVLSGKGDIFTLFVHKLSKALTLVDVLNNFDESFAGIVAGFTWLYSLIVISVFLIILFRYYLKSQLSQKERILVTNLTQFHQTIGFYISIIILMQLATNSSNLVKVQGSDPEDNIFNYRTFMSLHVFFITTNYLCGLIFALLSYHPFPSENPLGARSSGAQMILFVAKALLIPVLFADGSEDNTYLMWTVNIIAVLVFGSRYLFTVQTFHYFHPLAMGISANFSLIATLISLTNLIGLSIPDKGLKEINSILYSEVLISILVIKLSEVNFNGILERSFDKKENSVNNVMVKFFLLRKLWKKAKAPLDKNGQRDQNEFQLKGIFKYYTEDSKIIPSDHEEALNFIMSELLTNAIKTLRRSDDIKLIFAYFLISQNLNPTTAIFYLLQICKDKRTFNFIAANYLLNSGNLLENNKTATSIDLKSFMDYETTSTQFTQQVYSISKEYVEFWKNYYGPSLEVMDLLKKSRSLEKKAEIISRNWERYSRIYPNFGISLISVYAAYVKLVRNAPYSAFKLESKARSLRVWREKLLAKYDPDGLESPNNIVLEVSLDSKNTGKIIYASPNTLEYLGWTQKEMIHQHISNFMLPSLRDKFQRNFFENEGFENSMVVKLDSKTDLFLLTKEGYAKSANVYTALHPYLEEHLAYVMIIRIKKVESEIIILNDHGGLEGMTSNLARHLDIPTKQRVHLSEFCKNGDELGFNNSQSLISIKKGDPKMREKEAPRVFESENINITVMPWKSKGSLNFRLNGMLDSVFYGNVSFNILSFPWNSLNDQDNGLSLKETSFAEEVFDIPEEGHFEQALLSEVKLSKRDFVPYSNRSTQRNLLGTLEPLSPGQFLSSPLSSPLSVTKEIRTGTYILSSNFDHENEGRRIKIKEEDEEENEEKDYVTGRATRSRKVFRANQSNTYSNLTTGTESLQRKIEKATYSLPYASYHIAFRVLCLIFTIFCGASLIGFKIQSFNVDRSVARNTMIVSNSTKRMEKLLEINLFATRLLAIETGLIDNDRNAWNGNPDLKSTILRLFGNTNTEMIYYNQAIRDSIYKISSKFQPRFFTEIEVIERGVTADNVFKPARKTDLFALIDEIAAAGDKFSATVSNNESFNNNEDLSFIRRNSKGDLLLAGEDVITLVSDDNKYRLDNSENTLKVLMVLASLFSLLILGLFGLIIHKFIQAREKFLNVVLRIEEEAINRHSLLVLNFCDQLYRAHMDGRKANISINHELAKIPGGGQTYKRRILHHSGFYRKEVTLIIFATILNIFLYAGFIFTLPIVISHHKKMNLTVSRIINADITSYQSAFLYYQTYLYVSQNKKGTLRNLTLAEQWNVTMTTLNQMQTNFTKLAQELREEEDGSEVLSYLIGNECEVVIALTATSKASCPTGLKGAITKGLLQVSSYIMAVCQNVKDMFDASSGTTSDMRNALNNDDLIKSESYMLSYWVYPYATISDLLRTQLTDQYKAFDKSFGTLLICWGVLYMILGTLVWWGIDKTCVNEKKSWRKILRLIPVNIVKENKLLQSYLFSSQPIATF